MCVVAGSGSDSDTTEPPDDEPLTKKQADYISSLTPPQRNYIYMVRGSRESRSSWFYEGKPYNSKKSETLSVEWLNENGMGRRWRRKTFQRNPNYWFRVPTTAKTKQCERINFAKMSNPNRKQCVAACTADAFIKFFDHDGLTMQRDVFISIRHTNPSFTKCCLKMRKLKKFCHTRPKKKIDPLKHQLQDNVLYLFQIRAVHLSTKDLDNSHTLCVFNKTIYDANIDRALELTRANLDICCVGGGSWVYDKAVRVARFVPKKSVERLIVKSITSKRSPNSSVGAKRS